MLPPSKKRARSASDKSNGHTRPKRIKKTNVPKPAIKPGKNVRLDELAWREVAMPDRLDDVEGFFGLEEVEDVEVVRAGGGFKFVKVRDDDEVVEGKGKGDDQAEQAVEEGGEEDAEEWGGIESGGDRGQSKEPNASKDMEPTTSTPPPKPKPILKKSKHTPSTEDQQLSNFDFSVLADEISGEDIALPDWASINLSLPTLRALARLKFTTPTPIQSAAIPFITSGRSLIGKASTGSGKTLAFGIPILEKYLSSLPADNNDDSAKPNPKKLPKDRGLTALIIAPTRELAHQITKHLTGLCYYTDLKLVTITGGLSVQKQQRLLDNGVDIIVATPGRLWEIVSEGQGWVDKLRDVKMLVLDEADRVLEEGHFKEVEQILSLMDAESGDSSAEESDEEDAKEKVFGGGNVEKKVKRKREKQRKANAAAAVAANDNGNGRKGKKKAGRQTLVFSATFHKGLQQKLAGKSHNKNWGSGELLSENEGMEYLLKRLKFKEQPEWVDVDPTRSVAEKVKEGIVECGAMEKDLYLYYLLLRYPCRTLIFTNSITSVRRLVPFLNHLLSPSTANTPFNVFPLHSQLPQKSRLRSLERFSAPTPPTSTTRPPILVATDVAARGLDIANVALVIHYHLPRTADMYVHRSGRTGRASSSPSASLGSSILLCAPGEAVAMARLLGKLHSTRGDAGGGGGGGGAKGAAAAAALHSLPIERALIPPLKPRVALAQKITEAAISSQKLGKEESWLRAAAEDLGVDVSDGEIAAISGRGKKGDRSRGKGRSKGGRGGEWDDGAEEGDDASGGTQGGVKKEVLASWKRELKGMLEKKVNLGFSTKYLTAGSGGGAGGVNLAEHLLRGEGHGEILGAERRDVVEEL